MNPPQVSVIVPTFRDSDYLKLCLQALDNQTYPKENYEVIVVNNCVEDNIEPLVKRFKQAHLQLEKIPGSYAARNKGLAVAKGDVIAFTDADCIPLPNWLENGVKRLTETENCGLVAGNIRVFLQNPASPKACEFYDRLFGFPQKTFLENDHYGATANVFTYKTVFERVGRFATHMKSGGDFEWGQRVFKANYSMIYAEDVCINHPARNSLFELRKKIKRIVDGHYTLMRKNLFSKARFFGGFLADLILPFRSVPRILADPEIRAKGKILQVIGISILLRYIKFYERIVRLQVGG